MKKHRRISLISLLCAAALLATLLAGCGSDSSSTSDTAEEEAAEEAEESTESAEETSEETSSDSASIFPLDETVTFTMYYSWSPHFVELGYDSPNDFTFFSTLEEMTNVHIDFTTIGADVFEENFLLMMATQDYTDIYFNCTSTYNGGISKAIDDEAWLDLSDYIAEYAPNYTALMESDAEFKRANYTDEGAIGEFMQYYLNSFNNGGNLVRQDWLDELGLDVPETYDDWYEVLSAFTTAYDLTDSIVQTVPTSGYWSYIEDGYVVKDGQVVNAYADEELAMAWLETAKKWYDAGLLTIDAVISNYTDSEMREKVLNSEVGIFSIDVDQVDTYAEQSVDEDYEVTAIGKPVVNAGDVPYDASQSEYGHGFTISTACENVELAVQWMDYWYTEEVELLANYGVEGYSFEYDEDGVPHFTSLVLEDEDGLNFALFKYAVDWGPTVLDWDRKLDSYTEFQQNALEVWCNNDASMGLPTYMSYTTDESSELAQYETDIQTLIDETIPKLITGSMSLDDYDTFVDNLNSCGLQEVLEIKQAAYERYMARGE